MKAMTLEELIAEADRHNSEMDSAFGKEVTSETVMAIAFGLEPIANSLSPEQGVAYFRLIAKQLNETADMRERGIQEGQ